MVVVIGLGSMGRRRVRLIKQLERSYKIVGVDLNEDRRNQAKIELDIVTMESLEEAVKRYGPTCAVICSAPLSHSKLIKACLENNMHVFTELNLVSEGYDENIALANQIGKTLFLSSTFLYREEVKKINEIVSGQTEQINYTYHIGQYLPDWHPWEDYKKFFVGDKRTNGCREIFAIELPWLIEVFGEVIDFKVVKSKMSSLKVDYKDNYLVILEHSSGHKGVLAVDVISRKPVRNLEIFSEEIYLSWDGSAEGFKIYNPDEKTEVMINLYDTVDQLSQYSKFVVENAYASELVDFFDAIEGKSMPKYSFEKDRKIIELIDRIEA